MTLSCIPGMARTWHLWRASSLQLARTCGGRSGGDAHVAAGAPVGIALLPPLLQLLLAPHGRKLVQLLGAVVKVDAVSSCSLLQESGNRPEILHPPRESLRRPVQAVATASPL